MKLNAVLPVLFVCFAMIFACQPPGSTGSGKIDSRLMRLMKQDAAAELAFIGECTVSIEDPLKSRIESTGVIIESIAGEIFTAKGTSENIQNLSRMPEIKRLTAPKIYHLIDHH